MTLRYGRLPTGSKPLPVRVSGGSTKLAQTFGEASVIPAYGHVPNRSYVWRWLPATGTAVQVRRGGRELATNCDRLCTMNAMNAAQPAIGLCVAGAVSLKTKLL